MMSYKGELDVGHLVSDGKVRQRYMLRIAQFKRFKHPIKIMNDAANQYIHGRQYK